MVLITKITKRTNVDDTPFFHDNSTGLILGLRPANGRRRYFVTTSLVGCVQA